MLLESSIGINIIFRFLRHCSMKSDVLINQSCACIIKLENWNWNTMYQEISVALYNIWEYLLLNDESVSKSHWKSLWFIRFSKPRWGKWEVSTIHQLIQKLWEGRKWVLFFLTNWPDNGFFKNNWPQTVMYTYRWTSFRTTHEVYFCQFPSYWLFNFAFVITTNILSVSGGKKWTSRESKINEACSLETKEICSTKKFHTSDSHGL